MSEGPLVPLDRRHLHIALCYAIKASKLVPKFKPSRDEPVGEARDKAVSSLADRILDHFHASGWKIMRHEEPGPGHGAGYGTNMKRGEG